MSFDLKGSWNVAAKKPPTRVLIVDDSPTMRSLIRFGIQKDPCLVVVGEAASALEARELVKTKSPDVMTLDVEMPGMSGLEFLRRLMRAKPMPVVMFSSLTAEGSEAAITALSLGAFECILKPGPGAGQSSLESLPQTIHAAAQARIDPVGRAIRKNLTSQQGFSDWNGKTVLIGASTGGVEALEFLVEKMPVNCPPILITQHMPAQFLVKFANRLDRIAKPKVRLAKEGDRPLPGEILIAPGGETHLVLVNPQDPKIHLLKAPKRTGHRPSVDEMMLSAQAMANRVVGVILTGMGTDGAEGMAQLKAQGATCLAQDEKSSVVFGMPRVAIEKGGVDVVLPLVQLPNAILDMCSSLKRTN
ncbi:two-component system, chemotaxis family, response regulator CheB [Aliiroseovarius crassostreae]|nr:chemotaxis response regulator protein-glutamate methylesterase [Aliiroseovarius crassostreae]SFU98987.1 two-component system, chemotaxis family, response regulator CheB [Aliiroseovarius crassostreae]